MRGGLQGGRRSAARRTVLLILVALLPAAWPAPSAGPGRWIPAVAAQNERPTDPDPCLGDNPPLAVPQYVMTGQLDQPALIRFRASADGHGPQEVLATQAQIGATWGLGVDAAAGTLYAAAFHKRATSFGPAGPGGIYRVDLRSGEVTPWLEVEDVGGDQHGPAGDGLFDQAGRDAVGKAGLGDLDLSEDGRELFTVNLASRRILRYRIADRRLLSSFAHGAAAEPWAESEARPFALAYRQGLLYHGLVRDASGSRADADLHAYVYASLPDGSRMRLVLDFPLDYPWQGPHYEVRTGWKPWLNTGQETLRGACSSGPSPGSRTSPSARPGTCSSASGTATGTAPSSNRAAPCRPAR